MTFTVRFSPEAEEQITSLFDYLASEASPRIASRYVEGILTFCDVLRSGLIEG